MIYGDKTETKQVAYWENDPFVMYFYDADKHVAFGSVKIVVKHPTTYNVTTIPTYMTPLSVTKNSSISYVSPVNSPFGPISTPIFNSAPLPSYTAYIIGFEFNYYIDSYNNYKPDYFKIYINQTQPSSLDNSSYMRYNIGSCEQYKDAYCSTRVQYGMIMPMEVSKPCYFWIKPHWNLSTQTKTYKMNKLQIVFEHGSQTIMTAKTFRLTLGIAKINDVEYTDLDQGLQGIYNYEIVFNKGDSYRKIIKTMDINPAISQKSLKILFKMIYIWSNNYGSSFPISSTFVQFDGDSPLRFTSSDNQNGSLYVQMREYNTTMSNSKTEDVTSIHELKIYVGA